MTFVYVPITDAKPNSAFSLIGVSYEVWKTESVFFHAVYPENWLNDRVMHPHFWPPAKWHGI